MGYRDYRGLQWVTGGYKALQEVTGGYKALQEVTRGYRSLHGVKGGYKGLQEITYICYIYSLNIYTMQVILLCLLVCVSENN